MSITGTVLNGVVVPDQGVTLPEGARVWIELAADQDLSEGPILPSDETYKQHLASIRESVAEMNAGVPGKTVEETFAQVNEEIRRIETEAGA